MLKKADKASLIPMHSFREETLNLPVYSVGRTSSLLRMTAREIHILAIETTVKNNGIFSLFHSDNNMHNSMTMTGSIIIYLLESSFSFSDFTTDLFKSQIILLLDKKEIYVDLKLGISSQFQRFPLCYLVLSVQFSRSVVSDALQPHELQHARAPRPS